ncbi:flagellin [Paeniroseomonas aquatica]|uniref:flagellin n=1 Tax=Paeniroseomonas aquatica TaxID=373043 RepID=UPI003619F49E
MARIDVLGRLDADAAVLRARMQSLTRQVTTGLRVEAPGDLAPQMPRVLDLRAEIGRRDTYGSTITQALARTTAAQQTLGRLGEIASQFGNTVAMKLDPNDPQSLPFAATQARNALIEVGQLLNTRQNDEYIFGGSDFAHPPVPDPNGLPTGGLASQIAGAIALLGPGNAASVAAATRAAALDDSPGVTPSPPTSWIPAGAAASRGAASPRPTAPPPRWGSSPAATPPRPPPGRPPAAGPATCCGAWPASPR